MSRSKSHPGLRRIEDFGRLGYVHHFRLESPSDIDESLQTLMAEAYRVGQQQSARQAGV